MNEEITIGHDAELFAINDKGEPCSCVGLVGGTKESPSPCELGALQEDNVMAELNITPAKTSAEFVKNTTTVMAELDKRLAKYHLKSMITPHLKFTKEVLNSQQAEVFGCEPDYSAWDGCENPIIDLSDSLDRYAGGHIHIGVPFKDDPSKIVKFIKYLDVSLGAGMVLNYGMSERAKTYGRLGAFRPTPYGVEYRMIDNSWLSSPHMMKWVFDITKWVAQRINDGESAVSNNQNKSSIMEAMMSDDKGWLEELFYHHVPSTYHPSNYGG